MYSLFATFIGFYFSPIVALRFRTYHIIPRGPAPFLDLPWDYQAKGLSFPEAALSMTSYFDHTYPFLGMGLAEPSNMLNQITTFQNENSTTKNYSSHDGYDYALTAGVHIGDPILAAGAGTAEYVNSCAPCGNMIFIDHGNGYQTRYLHMQRDGLIVSTPGIKVPVAARQPIGKVGATGNVWPAGDQGAHIHFGVYFDKNHDGSFVDNITDGIVDPFGWQSINTDPWETYSGTKSYYLWTHSLDSKMQTISSQGGTTSVSKYSLTFPNGAVSTDTIMKLDLSPSLINGALKSLGTSLLVTAKDVAGNTVNHFLQPFNLQIDFSSIDLSQFKTGTLSIYSSEDGNTWIKENTSIDMNAKKATASINHFSYFALMAEPSDTTPPTSTIQLSGNQTTPNTFTGIVSALLSSSDDKEHVDYTMYKLDDADWEQYTNAISVFPEAHHKITYYSVDTFGNSESAKTTEFDIVKKQEVPLEAKVFFDTIKKEIQITSLEGIADISPENKKNKQILTLTQNQNTLKLMGVQRETQGIQKINIKALQYNQDTLMDIHPTILAIHFDIQNEIYKDLYQELIVKGETKVILEFQKKTNKTTIFIKENGKYRLKEMLSGMKQLIAFTNKGDIKYSY